MKTTRLLAVCWHAEQFIGADPIASQAQSDALLCIGFIEGCIWDHGWKSWRAGDDMYFCLPDGFGYRDALLAAVSYREEHPVRLVQRAVEQIPL